MSLDWASHELADQIARGSVMTDLFLDNFVNTSLDAMDPTASQNGTMECSICFEGYLPEQVIVVLPCHPSHHFHRTCLKDWIPANPTCPLCRHPLASYDN